MSRAFRGAVSFDRFKLAFMGVVHLVESQDPAIRIEAPQHAMLLTLLYEEFERALPCGKRRPRAVNDWEAQ